MVIDVWAAQQRAKSPDHALFGGLFCHDSFFSHWHRGVCAPIFLAIITTLRFLYSLFAFAASLSAMRFLTTGCTAKVEAAMWRKVWALNSFPHKQIDQRDSVTQYCRGDVDCRLSAHATRLYFRGSRN